MWYIDNLTEEDKGKLVAHEVGHILGLHDTFKDTVLGNPPPPKKFSRANYMDYFINRKMFFKTQIQMIINNLEEGVKP